MNSIKKVLSLNREDYYTKHLQIVNTLLPVQLNKKEIEVLSLFMSMYNPEYGMFNSVTRKKVMERLQLSSGGLSNYITSMTNKGFLQRNTISGIVKVRDFIMPDNKGQEYIIRVTNNEERS